MGKFSEGYKKFTKAINPDTYFDEEKQRKIKEAVNVVTAAAPVVEAVEKPIADLTEKAYDALFGSKKDKEEKDGKNPPNGNVPNPPNNTTEEKDKVPSRDTRLDGIYDTVHQIGNNMPKGEQFMGIPSIMNSHALIRFEGIAGSDEHINVYDYVGNYKVRNSRVYNLVYNIEDEEFKNMYEKTKDVEGNTIYRYKGDDKNIRNQIGILDANGNMTNENEDLMVDEAGQLYFYDIDYTRVGYKFEATTKDSKKVNDKDYFEITVRNGKGGGNKSNGGTATVDWVKFQDGTPWVVNVTAETNPNESTLKVTENETITSPALEVLANEQLQLVRFSGSGAAAVDSVNGISGTWTLYEYAQAYASQQENGTTPPNIKDAKTPLADKLKLLPDFLNYKCVGFVKTKHYISRDAGQSAVSSHVLEPTTENLCNYDLWVGDEQFMYEWTDFMYCTYNDVISNNYLITLRRFPKPVWDSGKSVNQDVQKDFMTPIAKAVTWITDDENKLSEILKQTWGYKWKDLEAEVNSVSDLSKDQGNDIPGGSKLGKIFEFINDGGNVHTRGVQHDKNQIDPYKDGPMANQPMGPVNSITKTKTRDVGLEYTNNITLKFHYSLYSMGAINAGKAALDIIANMLSLTYSNAGFWGGANRFFKNVHGNYFSNDQKMMKAFNAGDFGGMLSSFKNEIDTALGNIGSFLSDLVSDPKKALMGMLNKGAKYGLQTMAAKNRPGVISFKSVLTGDPIGDWHLVIGNPFNPIAMIGNLIVKSCDFEFVDGQLGADDFPHEMIFTITLEHGKPRDKGDIESMFNKGQGKLHYAYKGEKQPWDIPVDTRVVERRGKLISKDYRLSEAKTDDSKNQTISRTTTPHPISNGLFINRRSKTGVKTDAEYWSSIYSRVKIRNVAGAVNAYKLSGQLGQKDLNEDKPPVDNNNNGNGNGATEGNGK